VRVRRGLPGALRRPLPPLSALLHVGREGGTKPTCGPATTRRNTETGHATAGRCYTSPLPGVHAFSRMSPHRPARSAEAGMIYDPTAGAAGAGERGGVSTREVDALARVLA
jgi:hypothetical protein